jgi:hypothetical protein
MNLHKVVSGTISAVNQNRRATLQISSGYTTNPDGSRTPQYSNPIMVTAQIQALTTHDLRHLEGLNIQGSQRSIYLNGALNGAQRPSALGGDLITIYDGTLWLTTAVLEQWDSWVKVAATYQNNA